jgi:hypothetical protein
VDATEKIPVRTFEWFVNRFYDAGRVRVRKLTESGWTEEITRIQTTIVESIGRNSN